MTKVNLTVTKNMDEVPGEIAKQLSEATEKLRTMLEILETLERAMPLGLTMESVSKTIADGTTSLESVSLMFQDMFNICSSFATIEETKASEEITERVRKEVVEFKFEAETKIGQFLANEKLYKDAINKFQEEATLLREMAKNNEPPNKISKKKITRKK